MASIMKEFKPIPGFEKYLISKDGEVRSTITWKTLKTYMGNHGYLFLRMTPYKKSILIHRAILLAFSDNPENKPYCNHKNGIKTDNRIDNLEWCTGKENRIHAVNTGLITNTTKGLRITSITVKCLKLFTIR